MDMPASGARRPPHIVAHSEIQDASKLFGASDAISAPASATIEIAKLLTVFDGQIDDAWREQLVMLGGGLYRLASLLDAPRSGGDPETIDLDGRVAWWAARGIESQS